MHDIKEALLILGNYKSQVKRIVQDEWKPVNDYIEALFKHLLVVPLQAHARGRAARAILAKQVRDSRPLVLQTHSVSALVPCLRGKGGRSKGEGGRGRETEG